MPDRMLQASSRRQLRSTLNGVQGQVLFEGEGKARVATVQEDEHTEHAAA